MADTTLHLDLIPDTTRLAAVLRALARHIAAAADDIEALGTEPDEQETEP